MKTWLIGHIWKWVYLHAPPECPVFARWRERFWTQISNHASWGLNSLLGPSDPSDLPETSISRPSTRHRIHPNISTGPMVSSGFFCDWSEGWFSFRDSSSDCSAAANRRFTGTAHSQEPIYLSWRKGVFSVSGICRREEFTLLSLWFLGDLRGWRGNDCL